MLKVYYGPMAEAIYDPAVYFKNVYEDAWLEEDFIKEMILAVDKSVVLSNGVIESPVLGKIPPTSLSGGVKALIVIYKERQKIFNASACGDNCALHLLHMAQSEDIIINLRHLMDFGNNPFTLQILNTQQVVHSMRKLVLIAGLYV